MEEENRKTEQSVGQKVQTTKRKVKRANSVLHKIRQILAVPILGKIVLILALILVVVFLLVGVINFFQSMPNQTRDRLDEIVGSGVTTDQALAGGSGSGQLNIHDKGQAAIILQSAANDLVLKGYDLEGYGFLDPNEGDYVRYEEEITGKVSSIQSKYLQAYIESNEATYEFAGTDNVNYVTRYSEDLVLQIVTEGDATAWVDKKNYSYFLELVEDRVTAYLDENDNIPMDALAQIISGTISSYNNNSMYKEIARSRGEVTQIRNVTEQEVLAFMEDNLDVNFSSGLIVLQNDNENIEASIDREKKQLVVKVKGRQSVSTQADNTANTGNTTTQTPPSEDGEAGVEAEHVYYYNLEGWLTKYARPYEFLLTLHLATMAPEFAYEVATSQETNAKVLIDFKQTSVEIDVIVDEKVTEGQGLTQPSQSTGTGAGITQADEILALDQVNADMEFWYGEFSALTQKIARKKAKEAIEKLADHAASQKVRAYVNACKNHKDAYGNPDPITPSQEEMDKIRRIVRREVIEYCEKNNIEDFLYDRALNGYRVVMGLTGIMTNVLTDVQDGTVMHDGQDTGIQYQQSENGELEWNESYDSYYNSAFESVLSNFPVNGGVEHPITDYLHYPDIAESVTQSISTSYGNVTLNFGNIDFGQMGTSVTSNNLTIDDIPGILQILAGSSSGGGSSIQGVMQQILEQIAAGRIENEDTSTDGINDILLNILNPFTDPMNTNTTDIFYIGVTEDELQQFMYIFQQIDKLEGLYKAIAALPSKVRFETYTPYIVQVTNHWFRNLTFRRLGSDTLEAFDAYSEDETRTSYQYYTRYFRRELDPLITLYANYPYGDPSGYYTNLLDNPMTSGYMYNVVELRYNAIEQIDNPRVTDNSAYIRSLINDGEYIIYDGEEKTDEQLSDEAKEPINISKISVNSYAALEAMPDETSEILVRNLKELFKNTNLSQDAQIEEFAETSTLKPLANIFPDYKPYTPWPNVWEKFEQGYTTMLFKNMNRQDGREEAERYHYLEAPTEGVITGIDSDEIEFTYRNLEGELNKLSVKVEMDPGITIRMLVEVGDTVTTGTNLAVMTVPESVFTYIIRVHLALTDNKSQKLYVPDYMEVPQRELTAEEIITLHNFIMNEGAGQGFDGQAALASVIFNRIKYPQGFVDAVDIFTTMEYTIRPPGGKNGSWLEKDLRTKLWGLERYPKLNHPAYGGVEKTTRGILMAIAMASRGYDPTKGHVPLGAVYYSDVDTEKGMFAGKQYTIQISNLVYHGVEQEGFRSPEDVTTSPYSEFEFRDDEDDWQKRFLLQLCITIKNSYYFENSEVLEKIIEWATMEQQEAYGTTQY